MRTSLSMNSQSDIREASLELIYHMRIAQATFQRMDGEVILLTLFLCGNFLVPPLRHEHFFLRGTGKFLEFVTRFSKKRILKALSQHARRTFLTMRKEG